MYKMFVMNIHVTCKTGTCVSPMPAFFKLVSQSSASKLWLTRIGKPAKLTHVSLKRVGKAKDQLG
jgi:hypothetical protein